MRFVQRQIASRFEMLSVFLSFCIDSIGNAISSEKKTPDFDRECIVLSFIIMNDSVVFVN